MSCVLVLTYSDGSGIQAAWGPYVDEVEAEIAKDQLKQWPLESGVWTVVPLLHLPIRQP